ncbi:hypothetical protein NDU88_002944 [Pleurodeles waltl]|uniref:Uncharacterized protein n=1 Tax=Pleurodeles waltl TaxID=8319 RepID=A0AAV7W223_PLEWA|nr:hypothetical protein NDU88_002944 [Pleurodeles waltl]
MIDGSNGILHVQKLYVDNAITGYSWEESFTQDNISDDELAQKVTEVGKILHSIRATGAPFKNDIELWSTTLATLFYTCVVTKYIPNNWRGCILHPIFNKGDKKDPADDHLIALLDIKASAYASDLLKELEIWADANGIVPLC